MLVVVNKREGEGCSTDYSRSPGVRKVTGAPGDTELAVSRNIKYSTIHKLSILLVNSANSVVKSLLFMY